MKQSEQAQTRREKLTELTKQKVRPYGGKFPKTEPVQKLVERYADGQVATTAGRLTAKRGHGGMTFADLRDASGKIQICLRQEQVGEQTYQLFLSFDLGDILGVSGKLFKTKTGEVTVQVEELTLLAKALQPLPEKWHGLKDVEIRYRQRYLDLIANEPVRTVFAQRSRLIRSLRETLERNGFAEVETPMMHPIPGGAAGAPFVTHHEALDTDLYLRLAPELYLKKLLVGGMERVYEINRSFRNEGLSTQHNPEFTMLEAYAAYQDSAYWMDAIQELIGDAAKALLGSLQFTYKGKQIDLTPPWERVSFAETLDTMGLNPKSSLKEIQTVLEKKGMKVTGLSRSQLVRLVEQLFEPKAKTKPLFVVDYWAELAPLAKTLPDNPLISDRFELFIGGIEVANAYSEQNDPIEQRKRLEAQLEAAGAKGKNRVIDEGFVEALEYGMPPAGGMGLGVDRLTMLLLDQPSIKDVILFPLLKSQSDGS